MSQYFGGGEQGFSLEPWQPSAMACDWLRLGKPAPDLDDVADNALETPAPSAFPASRKNRQDAEQGHFKIGA
jgi:hypothetical protein